MLALFQREECPYCAKVRQYLSDKSISFTSISSPAGSPSRAVLEQLGGKQQVPFLVDFDRGQMLYESSDIIEYVEEHYVE